MHRIGFQCARERTSGANVTIETIGVSLLWFRPSAPCHGSIAPRRAEGGLHHELSSQLSSLANWLVGAIAITHALWKPSPQSWRSVESCQARERRTLGPMIRYVPLPTPNDHLDGQTHAGGHRSSRQRTSEHAQHYLARTSEFGYGQELGTQSTQAGEQAACIAASGAGRH